MKKVKTFEKFVNESEEINEARTNFDVTVEEPFDKKREEMMAMGYKLKIDPITITGVTGTISDDITDVTIQFSNGDQLGYFNHSAPSSRGQRELTLTKSDNSGFEKHLDNELDLYLGSSTSVIGDLCLIYRDYIQGKIK